jgi:excinuclease ABC subunit C
MKLAETTAEQYRDRVERACEFLDGRSKESLADLEQEMHAAAAKLDFERAAETAQLAR